jgi:primosomal protein N'
MLLSAEISGTLQSVVQRAQTTIKSINDVQWIVDVDPQDMM